MREEYSGVNSASSKLASMGMIGARTERTVVLVTGWVALGVEAESEVKVRARTVVMMMVIVFILLFCLGLMKQIYNQTEGV